MFLSRFSENGSIVYSNLIGEGAKLGQYSSTSLQGPDLNRTGDIMCDKNDNLFIFGQLLSSQTANGACPTNFYCDHGSAPVGGQTAIIELDNSENILWATGFGGSYVNRTGGMTYNYNHNTIYIGGATGSFLDFPLRDEFGSTYENRANYGANGSYPNTNFEDGFIAKFALDITVTSNMDLSRSTKDNLKIYPVPFNDKLDVDMSLLDDGEKTIFLFDYLGKEVFHGSSLKKIETIDTRNMANGLYIASVTQGDKRLSCKIIKSE
jgi:hypothetical protein